MKYSTHARAVLYIAAALLATSAYAQTCPPLSTASPTPPNEARLTIPVVNTATITPPGTTVPLTMVTYTVYRQVGPTGTPAVVCTTTALTTSLAAQPTGNQCYRATAKSPNTTPTPNIESALSPVGAMSCKNIVQPQMIPSTPGAVTVAEDPTAYQIVQGPNQVTLLAFGRTQPGTVCNPAQSVTDMEHGTLYLVPWTAVTMPNGQPNTTRKTVFASCG